MRRTIGAIWRATLPGVALFVGGVCSVSQRVVADEVFVSGFTSNSVGRFDFPSGTHLSNLQSGVGLQGAICARVGPDSLLYVASEGSNSIHRYNVQTGAFVDEFVTAGAGGLDGPTAVTWNSLGELLVSSFNNDRVLRYDGQTGAPLGTLVLADGISQLNGPDNGTVVGPDGALWVPSYFSNRVLRYNAETGAFLGGFGGLIGRPRVIEFRNSMVYITAESQDSVRLFDSAGVAQGNFVDPGDGNMDAPVGMAWGPDGHLYVTSSTRDFVNRYDGTTGDFAGQFLAPNAGGIDGPLFLTFVPEPGSAMALIALSAIAMRARRR